MRRTVVPAALIVLVAGLALTGCSGSSTLDTASLQDKVTSQLAEQVGGTWTVACPADVPIATGGTFTCTATDEAGTTSTINVTQTDDQGNVTWEIPSTGLDTALLQTSVADELATQVGGTWTVTCPADVAIENGATFTCDATNADGETAIINVTQTDDQGNVTWELVS